MFLCKKKQNDNFSKTKTLFKFYLFPFVMNANNLLWLLIEYLVISMYYEIYPMSNIHYQDSDFPDVVFRYCMKLIFVLEFNRFSFSFSSNGTSFLRAMNMTRSHSIFLSDKAACGSFEQHFNACDVCVNVEVSRFAKFIKRYNNHHKFILKTEIIVIFLLHWFHRWPTISMSNVYCLAYVHHLIMMMWNSK